MRYLAGACIGWLVGMYQCVAWGNHGVAWWAWAVSIWTGVVVGWCVCSLMVAASKSPPRTRVEHDARIAELRAERQREA